MTDNEIIKALEIHSNDKFDNCEGCPYLEGDTCTGYAVHSHPFRDILDLINRQKAEIERLTDSNRRLRDDMRMMLNNDNGSDQIRAEAIKEFAEKVETDLDKRVSKNIRNRNPHWYIAKRIVRETAIEMTEQSVNYESSKAESNE